LPTLIPQESQAVTTETTLTTIDATQTFSGSGAVQSMFVKDTLRSLDFQVYYDQLFGTFAYQEIPAGMGQMTPTAMFALGAPTARVGQVGWTKTIIAGQPTQAALPDGIIEELKGVANGAFDLSVAPSADFAARVGYVAGLPAGLSLTISGDPSNLSGLLS
jgi:hypothetical protein